MSQEQVEDAEVSCIHGVASEVLSIRSPTASSPEKAYARLGVSAEATQRDKGLLKLGLSEDDLAKTRTLWAEQESFVSKAGQPHKPAKLLGYTGDQIKRTKAMETLGVSEEFITDHRARRLAEVGATESRAGLHGDSHSVPFINTIPRGSIKKEGWLMKRGARVKNWKKRFFVLTDYVLYYLAHPETDLRPSGEIFLQGASVTRVLDNRYGEQMRFAFEFNSANRVYPLNAVNEEDMTDWIAKLNTTLSGPIHTDSVVSELRQTIASLREENKALRKQNELNQQDLFTLRRLVEQLESQPAKSSS
eukprot:GILJ01003277.1.p1 GENE.GILJ01003277.1~~GILJ01003277.1.p1  ORF type:complete len:318 (+),score=60.57 GILJ01003277.1:42-956(+)